MASETSPPSTSASPTDNPVPQFSPRASPPTILAFLAIGIFTISIVIVLGWRRVQIERGMTTEIRASGKRREAEEVPKLWDLWSNRTAGRMEGHVRWNGVKPVAAMVIEEETPVPPILVRQASVARSAHDLRVERDVNGGPVPSDPAVSLQVVIAITMPSQHSAHRQMAVGHARDPSDRLDYSLGLYRCALLKEKG